MYKIYFYNLQYYSSETADSLIGALVIGQRAGFEFRVEYQGEIIAAWSVIGGTRYYN